MSGDWQQGLCGCFGNCKACICTYFLPCYVHGKIGEKVGESCLMCGLVTFVPLLNLICMAKVREKVREQKGIDGSFISDLLLVCCCGLCALSQEANEVGAVDMAAERQEIERE